MTVDIHTLVGAYVLDAINDIERAAFARHLAQCEACAAEVAELTETAARLGAATAEAPPPGLRAKVLAEVARTRQSVGRESLAAPAVARPRTRWVPAAAAAAVVAIVAGTATWVISDQRVRDERSRAEALANERTRVNDVLLAGDVQVRTTTLAGGGHLTVATSASKNAGVVAMSDLPVPPSGRVYQLWLMTGTSATSAGVLAADQHAGVTLIAGVDAAENLGVTIEPAGGSPTPTTKPLATLPLRT